MAVPADITFDPSVYVAAHTAVLALLDDADPLPGYISIRDADDVLLGTAVLDLPGGAVNGTTGQLVLTVDVQEDAAVAGGVAAYIEVCDGADTVLIAVPAVAGSSPVANRAVLNTTSILLGGPISVVSVTIG